MNGSVQSVVVDPSNRLWIAEIHSITDNRNDVEKTP
jgi:hypothetical protein